MTKSTGCGKGVLGLEQSDNKGLGVRMGSLGGCGRKSQEQGWILEPTRLGVGGLYLDANAKPCKVNLRDFPPWSSG